MSNGCKIHYFCQERRDFKAGWKTSVIGKRLRAFGGKPPIDLLISPYRSRLMPAAVPDIGVLRRDDVPSAVDLAQHASADALAVLLAQCIVHHLALDPEPRVQDCDVGGDERHFDLGRATRARPVRAVRAVQALHQVAEALATRGPGAVDGDELCVVGERRGDGASFNQAVDSR